MQLMKETGGNLFINLRSQGIVTMRFLNKLPPVSYRNNMHIMIQLLMCKGYYDMVGLYMSMT